MRPVEQGEGDSTVAVFTRAGDAIAAAVAAQRALLHEPWPTNHPISGAHGYPHGRSTVAQIPPIRGIDRDPRGGACATSHTVDRYSCPRLPASRSRDDLGEHVTLRDLGEHRLKDLHRPNARIRCCIPTCRRVRANSPPRGRPTQPARITCRRFVGRARELPSSKACLATDRLLTLTGAGGAGKTVWPCSSPTGAGSDSPDGRLVDSNSPRPPGGGDVVARGG